MLNTIREQTHQAVTQLLDAAGLQPGDILVVGCSSSEIGGERIGTHSSMDIAAPVVDALLEVTRSRGIYLAGQCCEHLNRAIVLEWDAARARGHALVNVLPQPKAGGSFATTLWGRLEQPVAVEAIQAEAGLDIGGTLIGMHLKPVAVPVRLAIDHIGKALVLAARTRPKFIGGCRAVYDETML